MQYHSILFHDVSVPLHHAMPDFFHDLNLDHIVDTLATGRDEYDLRPFFYTPLHDPSLIAYRQEVLRDIDSETTAELLRQFSAEMRKIRAHVDRAEKLYYKYEKERWHLRAAEMYCNALEALMTGLSRQALASAGMVQFSAYLLAYLKSGEYLGLARDTRGLMDELAAIRYCVLIDAGRVTVRAFEDEVDWTTEVEETFHKFRREAVKDYLAKFHEREGMNHIEAQILDRVALLNPETFSKLDQYYVRHHAFIDQSIREFEREVQFYLAYLEYIIPVQKVGLAFCYPTVSNARKNVEARDAFDLALASKLALQNVRVVSNDFMLRDPERILIVSGPNQGGKTTFARMFGQVHYLASLGCRVPGSQAVLYLFDRLFSHFEREEDIKTLRSKLEDDLVRIRAILQQATPQSIVVINEIFSSTALKDAIFLSRQVIEQISRLDLLGVCVTFLDELASFNEKTVSMVSTVDETDHAIRTYRIERRPADGMAYALAIAEKYHVTYDWLMERIAS